MCRDCVFLSDSDSLFQRDVVLGMYELCVITSHAMAASADKVLIYGGSRIKHMDNTICRVNREKDARLSSGSSCNGHNRYI